MLNFTTPEDGDIVVQLERREGNRVYVLQTVPGPFQYVLHTRQEAVAQATRFAKRQRVRAWLVGEGCEFVLIDDFRLLNSV
jgi:hypothetical protein